MPALHYARQAAAAGFAPTDSEYCAESNLHEIIGTAAAMCTTSSIIMLLRVLVRVFMTKSFGSDDYCMSVAWLMQLGVFICWLGERPYANGKHYTCITPRDFEMHGKWQYYHSLLTVFGLVLVKISIALFLMRLVPPGKRWKSFLWASIGMPVDVMGFTLLTACSIPLLLSNRLRWHAHMAMRASQRGLELQSARETWYDLLQQQHILLDWSLQQFNQLHHGLSLRRPSNPYYRQAADQ